MTLNNVARTAIEIAGPCGKDGGVDRLVMTSDKYVSADELVRIRLMRRL